MKISPCSRTSEGVGIRFIWDEGVSMYAILNYQSVLCFKNHISSVYMQETLLLKEGVSVHVTNSWMYVLPYSWIGKYCHIKKKKKSTLFVRIWKRCRKTSVVKIFILLNWHFLNYRVFGKKTPPTNPGKVYTWFQDLLNEILKCNLHLKTERIKPHSSY